MGRTEEAGTQIAEAKRLDPLSARVQYLVEYDRVLERNCAALIPANQAFLSQHVGYRGTRTRLAYCLAETGKLEQARAETVKLQYTHDMDAEDISFLAILYTKIGEQDKARDLLRQLENRLQHEYLCPYDVSVVHAALGQTDQAFAYLRKAYDVRADCIAFLKVEPRADPLRADARFQRLLQQVKLSR
jgi:tetratricopeptide (TPR) repeat protein